MFPSDQQRRLQVVNSVNPSIRAVAAPLQGGNVNPQGVGMNLQGGTYNPQQTFSSFAPINQQQTLGAVQVAHPGVLQVNPSYNAPPVFIPQTKGLAGAPAMAPGNDWVSNLEGAAQGVADTFHGIASLPPQIMRAPFTFANAFGNLGNKLGGVKGVSTEQQFANTPGNWYRHVNNASQKVQGAIDVPFDEYAANSYGGYTDAQGRPIGQTAKNFAKAGTALAIVGTSGSAITDAKNLLVKGKDIVKNIPGTITAAKGIFTNEEKLALEQSGIKLAEDSVAPAEEVANVAKNAKGEPPAQTAPTETPAEPTQQTQPSDNVNNDPNIIAAGKRENQFVDEMNNLRKQHGSDENFYNNVILNNVEADGDIGRFARNTARRVEANGENISDVLDSNLQKTPTGNHANDILNQSHYEDVTRQLRDVEKSSGQTGLYKKVMGEVSARNMNQEQATKYIGEALTNLRDGKPTVPAEQAVAQEAVAQTAPTETGLVPGEASATSVENTATGVADATNAAADANTAKQQLANVTGSQVENTTYTKILSQKNISQDVKDAISNSTHSGRSIQEIDQAAQNLVKTAPDTADALLHDKSFIQEQPDAWTAVAVSRVQALDEAGLTEQASALSDRLIEQATKLGQGLNAQKLIYRRTPLGQVAYFVRKLEGAGLKLSAEDQSSLRKALTEANGIADPYAREARQYEIAAQINEMIPKTTGDYVKATLATPRTAMATGDLSFGLRQGAVLGARYPKEWAEANVNSARMAVDPEFFHREMSAVRNATDSHGVAAYGLFKRMQLQTLAAEGKYEEAFAGKNILEGKNAKKVGVGHVVAGADRAFSGAATVLRSKVALKIIDQYGGVEKVAKEWSNKELQDLGRVINTASGRGEGGRGIVGQKFEQWAPTLSDTLFSPRLWKSRLDMVNPVYYVKLSPPARKVALESIGSFTGVVSATLAAAAAAGANVEMNPLSSDFGKIKVGDTRIDIMGGMQQNIVLAARELSGYKKSSTSGKVEKLGGGFGETSRLGVLGNAIQNKETPVLGAATRILKGKDGGGNPVNPWTEVAKLFIPINAQSAYGTYSNYRDRGLSVSKSAGAAIGDAAVSTVGLGTQTYGAPAPSAKKETVADANGDPIIGDNGKQVKIDKNLTGVARDLAISKVKDTATASAIKNTLNPNEKSLVDVSAGDLKDLRDSGKLSDTAYKQITAYKLVMTSAKSDLTPDQKKMGRLTTDQLQTAYDDGKINDYTFKKITEYKSQLAKAGLGDNAVPDGVTNDNAKAFLKKYNSQMTSYDQKKFLDINTKPTHEADNIAAQLNKDLPKELQFKSTNQLAKDFADYQKKVNTNPQYNDLEKRNLWKSFLAKAAKNQYSENVKSIFNEGGSNDLKVTLSKLSAQDLKDAVALDGVLYSTGETDSLKFSKKFRNDYGFGIPSKYDYGLPGGSGGSGSGSGGSSGGTRGFSVGSSNKDGTIDAMVNGQKVKIDPATGLIAGKGTGLSQLVPSNLSFKQPTIDTTPTKKTFKIKLPADVTGRPKPQRVTSLRAKRAKIL